MDYQTQVIKGNFKPSSSLSQLKEAEAFSGTTSRLIFLYLCSFVIVTINTYLGLGTESYSGLITEKSSEVFIAGQLLILGGKLAANIILVSLFIWFLAFVFSLFLEIPYKKALIVQMIVLTIHLFEQVITSLIFVLFDLNHISNPFSFGVLSQQFTGTDFWNNLFGSITLFHLLAISVLYYYLKNLTEKRNYLILTLILSIYLIMWLLSAVRGYIEVSVFF